jgi:hypothetical protein
MVTMILKNILVFVLKRIRRQSSSKELVLLFHQETLKNKIIIEINHLLQLKEPTSRPLPPGS